MKKSIRDWLPSERDYSPLAMQWATTLTTAFEGGDEKAVNSLLAQLGADLDGQDPLGKLLEYVDGIFKRDLDWHAPEWSEEKGSSAPESRNIFDTIRWAAEKMRRGEMQREAFKRGTASLLKSHLSLNTSALTAAFVAHHKLTRAMELRETCPEKAIDELARGAMCLGRMYVLLAHQPRARGAASKLARDPKQSAKTEAFKLWQEWQAGSTRHKSGAAFARHVVEMLPAIESTKAVERWVTQWRKDAKATK